MATRGGISQSISKSSEELCEFICLPCSNEGRNVEAISFCVECSEYLCSSCLRYHQKLTVTKTHRILGKAEMKAGVPHDPPSRTIPTERCTIHHGNVLDTYCKEHTAVCCSTCVSLDHRSCKGMAYLPTAAQGIKKSKEYKGAITSMLKLQGELGDTKETMQRELKTREKEKNDVLAQINDFRKNVMKRLDELETIATNELQVKHQAIQDKINADIKRLEEMLISTEKSIDRLLTSTGDNESKIFVCVKTGQKIEYEGKQLLNKMKTCLVRRTLNFSIDSEIEEYLNDRKSIGHFLEDEQVNYFSKFDRISSTQNSRSRGRRQLRGRGPCHRMGSHVAMSRGDATKSLAFRHREAMQCCSNSGDDDLESTYSHTFRRQDDLEAIEVHGDDLYDDDDEQIAGVYCEGWLKYV